MKKGNEKIIPADDFNIIGYTHLLRYFLQEH